MNIKKWSGTYRIHFLFYKIRYCRPYPGGKQNDSFALDAIITKKGKCSPLTPPHNYATAYSAYKKKKKVKKSLPSLKK